jgi:hypothetical protein
VSGVICILPIIDYLPEYDFSKGELSAVSEDHALKCRG